MEPRYIKGCKNNKLKINFSGGKMSISTKILALSASIIIVFSSILAFYAPNKAREMANDMLFHEEKFLSKVMAENISLGIQTMAIDDGVALQQSLDAAKNETTEEDDVKTISEIKVYDANLSIIKSLYDNQPSIKTKYDKLTFEETDEEIISYMPLKDQSKEVIGYLQINFSKSLFLEATAKSRSFFIYLALFVFVISISVGYYVLKQIIKKLEVAINVAENLAMGELDFSFENNSNDEIGKLLSSMNKMINSIKNLVADVNILSTSAVDGNLSVRVDAEKHKGDFKKIVAGVNHTLDAVINPLKVSADYIERIAKGDIPDQIKETYAGDFNEIKNNLNLCIITMNNLSGELKKLNDGVKEGRLDIRINDNKFDNVFNEIAVGINLTVDTLSGPIYKIAEVIQATASAANQISASTEEMASGSSEQASNIGEVAAAIEEMTRTIFSTTKNTTFAAESSKQSAEKAKEGGDIVNEVVNGMIKISEVVEQSANKIYVLGANSDKIGEIIQVINDIADQTNLLALNAAIEAARAGEQGRGFAVVADEVRKLAERTTTATKEIAKMIKQIQVDTSLAVESMKIGTQNVENGKHLVNKAGDVLKDIIESSEKVTDIIVQVAASSEEQSATSEQISKSNDTINNVIRESSTGINQVAGAAEDLNKLTENLQALVNQFDFSGNGNNNQKKHKWLN